MGRSLRRAKKTRQKVSVKTRRKPKVKSRPPADLKKSTEADRTRLGLSKWSDQQSYGDNYHQAGLVPDANASFGRNSRADAVQEKIHTCDLDVVSESNEVKEALHKSRPGYQAAAQRLSSHQRQIVQGLLAAHGEDVQAMVWDTKRNSMLLPASKLSRMIHSYRDIGDKGRCGFRVPHKRLW